VVSRLNLDGLRELVDIFKHRWDPIILVLLAERPRRRRELTQEVRDSRGEHIADGVLSEVLNRLQAEGLIVKVMVGANRALYGPTPAAVDWVRRLERISDLNAGARSPSIVRSRTPRNRVAGVTDDLSAGESPALDTSVPHSARVWNYWLGGKDNFQVDRDVGDQVAQAFPDIVDIARESRRFLVRAVTYLAGEVGIRQFLDIGTGLPAADNTHQVAQRINPAARIVYVDNDPLVLVHARALLTSDPKGDTAYLHADIHDPDAILAGAAAHLDFSQPVALMLLGILGNVTDYDEARSILRRLVNAAPVGSYLIVNDGTNVINAAARNEATRISIESGFPYIARSPEQIAAYFQGLDLIHPGVVSSSRWRPDHADDLPSEVDAFCGVARKQ
jgi:DNA-binding PadR family transcriptional regulator